MGREQWEEGYCSPLHTALELGLLSGENGLLSPPRPGRELRDENANESGSSAIFVSNDRTGSRYTKPMGSNYMVNMKCLSS